jgi:thymidine kinase
MAKLYFRYSAMNAGKSTALLQVAYNYEENGRAVRVFTSSLDDRYGVGNVTSRLGPQRIAFTFDETVDFYERLAQAEGLSCVLIDEAQFLSPEQVRQLHRAAHVLGIPVICYGIRTDFQGEPFPGSIYLLALADSLEEIKTICACGKKATMNPRIDERGQRILDGDQIAIEGTVRYVQQCPQCFYIASRRCST